MIALDAAHFAIATAPRTVDVIDPVSGRTMRSVPIEDEPELSSGELPDDPFTIRRLAFVDDGRSLVVELFTPFDNQGSGVRSVRVATASRRRRASSS